MRVRNPLLLIAVASVLNGCGARTGNLDDDSTWGSFDDTGGAGTGAGTLTIGGAQQTGGATWWATGGTTWHAAGGATWHAAGGATWHATGGTTWHATGGTTWHATGGTTWHATGGTTWHATGGTTWHATGGTTWHATGGTTWHATAGASTCPVGTLGCACDSNGLCASPYTCYSGYCALLSGSGGAPAYGGSTSVPYGGSRATGGSHNTSLGGQISTGGRSQSTGGVSPVVACGQSLQACAADSGCYSMLTCIMKYSSVCNSDLNCYLLQCSSSITGSSAALAIQLFQDCSSLLIQ